jgi:Family of unknown function (DUF6152)
MMKAWRFALIASVCALGASSAVAHHSFAMYARDRTITLSGTVKDFVWTSPHVTIEVLTDNPRVGAVAWSIEGSSPPVLARGGWNSTSLRPGDKVSLGIHPRKDGAAGGLLADEQQVIVNGQPARGILSLPTTGENSSDR